MRAILFFATILVAANCFSFKGLEHDIHNGIKDVGHGLHHLSSQVHDEISKIHISSACPGAVEHNLGVFKGLADLAKDPAAIPAKWNKVANELYTILSTCSGNPDEFAWIQKAELNQQDYDIIDCASSLVNLAKTCLTVGNIIEDIKDNIIKEVMTDVQNLKNSCPSAVGK
mmetsp:Transcript_19186/g.16470  ORF Transcript_19186/g.16470 Transcript_19186/m.16470 type:complete len:171 (+) Transcript_19186:64-576(+)